VLKTLLRAIAWLTFGFLLACVAGFSGYLSFSAFVRGGVIPVPEIVGQPEEIAREQLATAELKIRIKGGEGQYDAQVPAEHVLRQRPQAGSLVKRGAAIDVTLSLGPELVLVPDVRGRALQAAQVTLHAVGLSLGSTPGVYGLTGVPGTVVEQNPYPGLRASRSTSVDLYLSRESPNKTFVMPDLVYRDYDAVRHFFERRGIRVGSVKPEPYEGIAPGIILRQFPLPGHPLRQQDVISLVVATPERIVG